MTRWPSCPECGGEVELTALAGRTREIERGVHVEIPGDVKIPTCTSCGEEMMSLDVSEPLDALLRARLAEVNKEKPPPPSPTCKHCRYSKPEVQSTRWEKSGYLVCLQPKWVAGYNVEQADLPPDGVHVENDEEWAFRVGPDFGCVHWALRS